MTLPSHIDWLLAHAPGLAPRETGQLIQTHISFVVLAGDRVYKVKKPVDFGFLDFTTLDKRRHMCEAEVRLNSRLSPDVYLGVEALRQEGDAFAIGRASNDDAPGEVVDYAVVMRRLPAGGMLDAILARGLGTPAQARAIADLVADFHLNAERDSAITEFGSRTAIETNWAENFDQTEAVVGSAAEGGAIDRATFDALRAYVTAFLEHNDDLLRRRRDDGWIRDGHGDLKTTAIAFQDPDRPADTVRILDCIEFNDRMRYGDVANDLAFLCMDFESRGRPDLSDELLARYLAVTLDADLPLLLPFYECYRAYVIAKISTFAAADPHVPPADRDAATQNVRRHFQLARAFAARGPSALETPFALSEGTESNAPARTVRVRTAPAQTGPARPATPRLIVVAGPSGSGKSTLATALAGRIGARWLSSDLARKRLAGLDPAAASGSGLNAGLYDPSTTARTYNALLQEAESSLQRGRSVILDATFSDPAQRDAVTALAARLALPCDLLICEAGDETVRQRLRLRAADPAAVSEGTWQVYLQQRDQFTDLTVTAAARVHRIPTESGLAQSIPAALRALALESDTRV